MDAIEREKRVLECLRRLDIGESISADGIADEIGEKHSDVYDAVEDLEGAKLVEMFPAFRKGSDPTYTLSIKGRHAVSSMESLELGKPDIVGAIPEPVVKAAPAPSADRVCRFCGKLIEPNKVRRHETLCGKNPQRVKPVYNAPKERNTLVEPLPIHRPPLGDPVPPPCEYAPDVLDDGISDNWLPSHTNPLSAPTMGERERLEGGPAKTPMATAEEVREAESILQDLRDNDTRTADRLEHMRRLCDDVLAAHPEPNTDEITASRDDEVISMTATPGTSMVLRLLSACQMAVRDGADISLDAHVKVAEGYYVNIVCDLPTDTKEAPPCP